MLAGLLAICLATVLSAWLQFHIVTHTRPVADPALHLKIADPRWSLNWDRLASFPSDTATLYFSLVTVIILENRLLGLFCFLWVTAIIAVPRVVFGWHYPSDILGSLVLGPGCVFLFNKIPYLGALFERVLKLFEGRMYVVHALLFVFLAERSTCFKACSKLEKTLCECWDRGAQRSNASD
jgi:membrane-associated phospholipid phosphatase